MNYRTYQVTIYCTTGQYKPISCIVKSADTDKSRIINQGVQKICAKKYWTKADVKKYGYTKTKVRKYEKGIDK